MKKTQPLSEGLKDVELETCVVLVGAKLGTITLKEIHIHTHNTTK